MNATRWNTLSGFVQWLGKTGYAKIDFVEEKNQWYLEYIDNSPEKLERDAEKAKLAKSRKDDAERDSEAIKVRKLAESTSQDNDLRSYLLTIDSKSRKFLGDDRAWEN